MAEMCALVPLMDAIYILKLSHRRRLVPISEMSCSFCHSQALRRFHTLVMYAWRLKKCPFRA